MHVSRLLPVAFVACVSAVPLTDILNQNNGNLSTLINLLQTVPAVTQMLTTTTNITIFAPSNNAFTKLLQRNPNAARLMNSPNLLTGVLQYHVVPGRLAANEFVDKPRFEATMLAQPFANVTGGQKVELAKVNNTAMLFGGYKQASLDLAFDGGVLHIVDTVLTVPDNPANTAIDTGLTSLAGALNQVQLVDAVNSLVDITIFAPSNLAFEAIGGGLGSLQPQDLANILQYHVLTQPVRFSTDLLSQNQQSFLTLMGQNVTVRKENGQLFVNSARVVIADVLTSNGVVHVIDNVLNPANQTATPNPSILTQIPAFAGVASVPTPPFAEAISPTATFIPATVALNDAPLAALPTAALLVAGGAALLAVNLANL
ncbi:Fasciclin-domain-containing protein [Thozetella sp. PMI_491]|nr:Fasciclin-domain-containing protein [Thozetella sp. PMI_491]